MQKLIVTKYKDGSLVKSKEGSDRASIYVTCSAFVNRNGSIWEQKRIAHLSLPKALAESFNVSEGADLNNTLKAQGLGAHKVIMMESIEPFFDGQEPKTRGAGGDVITDDAGNNIYQDYKCVPDSDEFSDITVERSLTSETVAEEGDLA